MSLTALDLQVARRTGIRLPAPSDLPQWQAECNARFGGPNPSVSWLHLDWYADEGVNRLILYQMIPAPVMSPIAAEQVALGPPRWGPLGNHVGGASMTRQQWDLWQRFRAWAKPFWIIQGSRGGHPRNFSHAEAQMLKMRHKPFTAPVPGELPYAPWDGRVIGILHERDLWHKCASFAERKPEDLDAEMQQAMTAVREAHVTWLEDTVGEAVDELLSTTPIDALPSGNRDTPAFDWDEAKHELVTGG